MVTPMAMASGMPWLPVEDADAFEAVEDEHSEDGGGQHPPQIPDDFRRLLVLGRENQERAETG